jgi:glutamyl-Q tRNA(Asp) synthetase
MTFTGQHRSYVGRFAPSPSGPLHFGSLVTALGSFLDARAHKGKWLLRIEDLDPPREQSGAADAILHCLEAHQLFWDDSVLYQSHRHNAYEKCLDFLKSQDWIYACDCSRQELQNTQGIYQGYCRNRQAIIQSPSAWRLKLYDLPNRLSAEIQSFDDLIQGEQIQNLRTDAGDQILKRRDGFYAYQLAVVLDDIEQKITHIIRGRDLLDVTASQIFFFNLLKANVPQFGHLPLAIGLNGQKLSKQNKAPNINPEQANQNLWLALEFLGQNPPAELKHQGVRSLLDWAILNWQLDWVPQKDQVV